MSSILQALRKKRDDSPELRPLDSDENRKTLPVRSRFKVLPLFGVLCAIGIVGLSFFLLGAWYLDRTAGKAEVEVLQPTLESIPDRVHPSANLSESVPGSAGAISIAGEPVIERTDKEQPVQNKPAPEPVSNNRPVPAEKTGEANPVVSPGLVEAIDPVSPPVTPTPVSLETVLTLNGILYNQRKPMAIINGRLYGIGDEVEGHRIEAIFKDGVRFRNSRRLLRVVE